MKDIRSALRKQARIDAQLKKYANPQRPLCLKDKSVEVSVHCVLGAKNSNSKTGFMFGDSHSNHLWEFMDTLDNKQIYR